MKNPLSVQTARPNVDVIIVTCDSPNYLDRCLKSLLRTSEPIRIIIVNNGNLNISFPSVKNCVVLKMAKNLGWMAGVNCGIRWSMENSPAKFICWMNDDTQVLDHDFGWMTKMINCFQLDPNIGAVGPTSNAVMGMQSIQHDIVPPAIETTRLSGLCFLTKKEVIDKVGFLDESLPGGDDLDYSIRVRNAGYKLCVCRRSFLIHHYAVTGKKVHGNYWDSQEHTEKLNNALILKHGFKTWYKCVTDSLDFKDGPYGYNFEEPEEKIILSELAKDLESGTILDLGCGGKKIHPRAIGVDIRSSHDVGVGSNLDHPARPDIVADVTDLSQIKSGKIDAIVARHLLEHLIDPIKAIKAWKRIIKDGGKLLIMCPDYRFCEAISVDPSHVHAYTPESVRSILETVGGFQFGKVYDVRPGYVFMVSASKISVREPVCVS